MNWHLDLDFCPSACVVCSLELKKQKIWSTRKQEDERKKVSRSTRFGALSRRNTKARSCRETDHLGTILTNCPVFVCFLLQKKRVKRDFVEDIMMPDSPINEVQKIVFNIILRVVLEYFLRPRCARRTHNRWTSSAEYKQQVSCCGRRTLFASS